MKKYRQWTARLALWTLIPAILLGIAEIPTGTANDPSDYAVWPLHASFSRHHLLAAAEVFIVWLVLGVVVVILIGVGLNKLYKRGYK